MEFQTPEIGKLPIGASFIYTYNLGAASIMQFKRTNILNALLTRHRFAIGLTRLATISSSKTLESQS
jgi:hypothetical protein